VQWLLQSDIQAHLNKEMNIYLVDYCTYEGHKSLSEIRDRILDKNIPLLTEHNEIYICS